MWASQHYLTGPFQFYVLSSLLLLYKCKFRILRKILMHLISLFLVDSFFWVNFSLIRRREALVYNTPEDHVTRDIREGVAKLSDLRFRVLDSAGLETEASSGSILDRTSRMTANVLARSQIAVFLIDVRSVSWMTFCFFF